MISNEYLDIMRDIQINGKGIGRSVWHAQQLAIKLGYALGVTEGHLQTVIPKHLIYYPEILDDLIEKSGILADDLETTASVAAAQIATIKKLITTARALANSEETDKC
ncbi:hypothetical protein [Varibaculum cambriense]|uniref:Uncharacterized protein n=1 Tax=Varibaculum cambriense TaxID=184870 RepID=A0ABX4UQJ8_9ACTO|nr:hypothetical protein [Varibaculum cambriense]PMB89399.1 hypothetical protein CJ240_06430 [Varibaculum cambriense]